MTISPYADVPRGTVRAARGLIRAARAAVHPQYGYLYLARDLVGSRLGDGTRGTCTWCGGATENRRRTWHRDCLLAFFAARGLTVTGDGWYLIEPTPCALCDTPPDCNFETDHKLAIGVAIRMAKLGRRGWLRAWWIGNLQNLCRPCHLDKTNEDRSRMMDLDRLIKGQPVQTRMDV